MTNLPIASELRKIRDKQIAARKRTPGPLKQYMTDRAFNNLTKNLPATVKVTKNGWEYWAIPSEDLVDRLMVGTTKTEVKRDFSGVINRVNEKRKAVVDKIGNLSFQRTYSNDHIIDEAEKRSRINGARSSTGRDVEIIVRRILSLAGIPNHKELLAKTGDIRAAGWVIEVKASNRERWIQALNRHVDVYMCLDRLSDYAVRTMTDNGIIVVCLFNYPKGTAPAGLTSPAKLITMLQARVDDINKTRKELLLNLLPSAQRV